MNKERLLVLPLLGLLFISFWPLSARAERRCFSEATGYCIDGRIRDFWENQGGLAVFGYPLGPEYQQTDEQGSATIQRFERVRLEYRPQNAAPYDVQVSRSGAEALTRIGRDWNSEPKADPATAHYIATTGQAIAPEFWDYWSSHGLELNGVAGYNSDESTALFGLPLTAAAVETNASGDTVLTQWFERARFEFHADSNQVLLGLLEREANAPSEAELAAIQNQPAADAVAPAQFEQSPAAGGFIRAEGSQLTLNGQVVRLKGVNYYPQKRPWREMWEAWDGTQMERELRQARDELGINVVRILVPYKVVETGSMKGTVSADLLDKLKQTSQIASNLNIRLIFTLFDFYGDYPAPDTGDEEYNYRYIRSLVGNFVGDDRILAWDLHNEPDHYGLWDSNPQQVLQWTARMADELRRVDPNHLVTVGMGQYQNQWVTGPDGRSVLDISDIISLHSYNSGDVARQVSELRARTSKPIILGEFGWPTGPACAVKGYDEQEQERVYRQTIESLGDSVAGLVAWSLRDFDSGPTRRWDSREEHYGLYRPDGSLKPAAEVFRSYVVSPLPATLQTNQKIVNENPREPGGKNAPTLVPGSNYFLKDAFRRAWDLFGGQDSFGLPISEAFVREDGRVVQYFENAVLEYYPEAAQKPEFQTLTEPEQIMREIRPQAIGRQDISGRGLSGGGQAGPHFQAFDQQFYGSWRLGAAISDEVVEQLNGVPTTVQYFENGVLETSDGVNVRLRALGSAAWSAQCQSVGG